MKISFSNLQRPLNRQSINGIIILKVFRNWSTTICQFDFQISTFCNPNRPSRQQAWRICSRNTEVQSNSRCQFCLTKNERPQAREAQNRVHPALGRRQQSGHATPQSGVSHQARRGSTSDSLNFTHFSDKFLQLLQVRKTWRKRWFQLESHGGLCYYKDAAHVAGKPLGVITVAGCDVREQPPAILGISIFRRTLLQVKPYTHMCGRFC